MPLNSFIGMICKISTGSGQLITPRSREGYDVDSGACD